MITLTALPVTTRLDFSHLPIIIRNYGCRLSLSYFESIRSRCFVFSLNLYKINKENMETESNLLERKFVGQRWILIVH